MKIYIQSSHQEYFKDYYDICKIFISEVNLDINQENRQYDIAVYSKENVQDDLIYMSFYTRYLDKKYISEQSAKINLNDRLLYKKEYKKLFKSTLYNLLKQIFGKTSPWGSLTGVRPTYLLYEALSKYNSLEKVCSYLQNEYDISKNKVSLLKDTVISQSRLPRAQVNEVDIYVGIPFCTSRCSYCTFASNSINDQVVDTYLINLFLELKAIRQILQINSLKIRAVYVGGGTPTAINNSHFTLLLDNIVKILEIPKNVEFTVEAGRPDTINDFKLECMSDNGVNRISINPQTLNDDTLHFIGRKHSANDFFKCYEKARLLGFNNINTDLIAALPNEDFNDFKKSVNGIVALQPDSVTVHTLSLKKNSVLSNSNYSYNNVNVVESMVDYARNTMKSSLYEPYYLYRQKNITGNHENVAYAKFGKECLYNVDMMEETVSILAAGAGTISKRVYKDKLRHIDRAANVSDLRTYISRISDMIDRKNKLFIY